MKKLIYLLIISFSSFSTYAQSFSVEISTDSILIGNYVELSFTIENIEGEFEAPSLSDFEILSGPNVSSSMQIANGKMSSKKQYSYYIKPYATGNYLLPSAYLITHEKKWETPALPISVVDNPNNIIVIPQQKKSIFFNAPEFPLEEEYENPINKKPQKTLKRL